MPTRGDAAALAYIANLVQQRAALLRPAVTPVALQSQSYALAEVTWLALLSRVIVALDACEQGRYSSSCAHVWLNHSH